MDVEDFRRILDHYARTEVRGFTFASGESLLHPRFFEIIEMIRVAFPDVEIQLYTNGIILARDNEVLERLMRSGLSTLVFSLHGASQGTVSLLQPGVSVDAIVRTAQRIKRESHIRVSVHFTIQDENLNEMRDFVDLVADAGLQSLSFQPVSFSTHTSELVDYADLWRDMSLRDILVDAYARAHSRGVEVAGPRELSCSTLVDVVAVNGDVSVCIGSPVMAGNVFYDTPSKIHRSQRAARRRLTRAIRSGRMPESCRACAVRVHHLLP